MKKVSILAAIALMVVGCNKKMLDEPLVSGVSDVMAPISFGTSLDVELTPSKAAILLPEDTKLGVFAFDYASVPTSASAANSRLWYDAENLQYIWNAASSAFIENETVKKLYWPTTGSSTTKLSFVSYFPYRSASATDEPYGTGTYKLTQDMTDQTAAPDYAFAWATLANIGRPNPVTSQNLAFTYKVAKLSFRIVGEGTSVGDEGIKMQVGGTGAGVVAIRIYGASTGFYKNYTLNLLTGVASGTGNLNSTDKMLFKGVDKSETDDAVSPAVTTEYVEAEGYVVPSVDAGLKTDGIVVEIVYNDGTSDQSYTAEIKTSDKLTGNAALANGLVAGTHYKYTLKLGKSLTLFTGKVVDWTEVPADDDIVLED